MALDSATKAVFSELDGFLVVVTTLAGLQDALSLDSAEADPLSENDKKVEIARICLMVLCEAVSGQPANRALLQVRE